jgi:phenylpropionate dioxygenase-like ring-hydroxylating dioxygenase large terminal subunit
MLSHEENELLTRVGPGTPMGRVFRSYWLPALLAEELLDPDGAPVRVTLLGEPLVAFRDSGGQVALLGAHCPHRGASLFFGRNEEHGLRCVYHGWKFDMAGACVDMPNEPAESSFKSRVHHTAYPCMERGGMIWTYMGPPDQMPELPQMEWMLVPPEQRYVHKRYQACNYLQNVEGEVDSSHVSFLHRSMRSDFSGATVSGQRLLSQTRHYAPTFEVRETDYGLVIGARRDWDPEQYYWRVTQFLLPSYTMIPSEPGSPISYTGAVPIDDEQMWGYTVTWRPDRPLSSEDVARIESWTGIYAEVDPRTYLPIANKANDYLIDRAQQRSDSFTGIRGIREQDLAVQEDQYGTITDRTKEHLGSSDAAIIAMRRQLLRTVSDVQNGVLPYSAQHGDVYRVRSAAFLAERAVPLAQLPTPTMD